MNILVNVLKQIGSFAQGIDSFFGWSYTITLLGQEFNITMLGFLSIELILVLIVLKIIKLLPLA